MHEGVRRRQPEPGLKLTISNIAWHAEEDEAVAAVLNAAGVPAIEVAPTRLFADPIGSTREQRQAERERWRDRGLSISSAQSLLFARPELRLFGPAEERQEMLRFLQELCAFCAQLGAGPLVFGSPKARRRGDLQVDEAFAIAVEFFRELGTRAAEEGCCVCIEPNPPAYGCDFVTTSDEGLALVEAVGSPGFGLHLDAAGMFLAGENPVAAVRRHALRLRHFHLSAPNLELPRPDSLDYRAILTELKAGGYAGWVSVEMRAAERGTNAARVRSVLELAQSALRSS
jgi:sugar phosphate isomerase/epimerase